MHKRLLHFMLILLLSSSALVQAESQSLYVLALLGPTWGHSSISVLVVPQPNATWWNPTYVNSTLRAISQWNEAISFFAQNYSDFAYLSELNITPKVSNSTSQSFDVQISWIKQFENETCNAGETRTTHATSNTVKKSDVQLAAYDCRGTILSEVDMQNVALHELGHTLVLGHANNTKDVMYFSYTLGNPVRALSALDVYGVAKVFRWLAYSPDFNPDNQGKDEKSTSLPSTIQFEFLPIAQDNLPPQSLADLVSNLAVNIVQFVLRPEVLIAMVTAISVIVTVGLWTHKARKSADK
jgi:predicted Zn-dependent protease